MSKTAKGITGGYLATRYSASGKAHRVRIKWNGRSPAQALCGLRLQHAGAKSIPVATKDMKPCPVCLAKARRLDLEFGIQREE